MSISEEEKVPLSSEDQTSNPGSLKTPSSLTSLGVFEPDDIDLRQTLRLLLIILKM